MPGQRDDGRTRGESRQERSRPSRDLTDLARAALVGSSDDRDRFLRACWQYAYTAAIRSGRKHNGAEDSAQEAVIAVHGLVKAAPPELKPETAGALASVIVLRSARAAAGRRAREAGAATHVPTAREGADPAHEVESAEWAHLVRELVDTLPQPLRRLIHRRYWDDSSTREIAREVGTSKSSILRLLAEAEASLKDKLQGICLQGGPAEKRPGKRVLVSEDRPSKTACRPASKAALEHRGPPRASGGITT